MLAYNHWANEKVLASAGGLAPDALASVSSTLAHAAATQLFWHANWTGADFDEPTGDLSLDALRALYARADDNLRDFERRLNDDEWNRSEAWWKRWGVDVAAPLGITLFQVISHGIQHRSEVAVVLTEHGCSPGDLDYLVFLRQASGSSSGGNA